MRKIFPLFLVLIFFNLIAVMVSGQTSGELSVSVSTSDAGGNYKPRNVLAIWIEDSNGKFVKTLLAYADRRKTHLNNWETTTTIAGSAFNTVDAISGATKLSHATRSCKWNGNNHKGELSPDGTYKVCMELTDKNSTGNYATYSFVKGSAKSTLTPNNSSSFSSVAINWTPVIVSTIPDNKQDQIVVYPNPGNGFYSISGSNIKLVEVCSLDGKLLGTFYSGQIDIRHLKKGTYLFRIKTKNKQTVIKTVKL